MKSKAYKEGFNSNIDFEYDNPYSENSSEFDDYERGRSQKLKRSPNSRTTEFQHLEDDDAFREEIDRSVKEILLDLRISYKDAKGK